MATREQKLVGKVKATNLAYKTANEIWPKLIEVFKPYVGQKITKVDGSLLAKIRSEIPDIFNIPNVRVVKNNSDYSLSYSVSANVMVDDISCIYADVSIYVGYLDNGVLTKLGEAPNLRSDYTPEEIIEKRAAYKAAQKAADDAKNAIRPFEPEYDN